VSGGKSFGNRNYSSYFVAKGKALPRCRVCFNAEFAEYTEVKHGGGVHEGKHSDSPDYAAAGLRCRGCYS